MNSRSLLILSFVGVALVACEEAPAGEPAGEGAGGAAAVETGAGGGAAAPAAAEEPVAKPARRFLEVKGTVTLSGAPASLDMEIGETGEIETGADGHAVITLGPGSVVEVREKTKFSLGKSARKDTSIKLLAGTLWSFLPNAASYEVETLNAIAGVRGTVFYTEAYSEKKSYICACDGSVSITGKGKKTFEKTPESEMGHIAFYVKGKGKKAKPKSAKRERHTEDQKMALMPYITAVTPKAEE